MRHLCAVRMVGLALLWCIPLPLAFADSKRSQSLAEEAYYQIEGNVFNRPVIEQAFAKLHQARRANPNDPWVYLTASLAVLVSGYQIGDWYTMRTFTEGTVAEALVLATKAVALGPSEGQCHAHLARLKIIQGEYRAAWDMLTEAYKHNPDSFYPWYFRGIIAEKMRDVGQGKSYFDEAEKRVAYAYQSSLINLHRQTLAKIAGDLAEQERLLKENIAKTLTDPMFMGTTRNS